MDILKFLTRTNRSQTDLAKELGLDVSSVNNWIRGKNTPKYEYCEKLLKMGMGIEELFSDAVWEKIKKERAADFKAEVRLSPEECAEIVRHGLDAIRQKHKAQV